MRKNLRGSRQSGVANPGIITGYTVYRVRNYYEGSDIPYEDGRHILYVNAEVDDHTEIAGLMKYFKEADPNDMSQGELSKRIHYLKCEEGGYEEMCEISEKIYKEGIEKGMERGRIYGAVEAYKDLGMPEKDILKNLCLKFSLSEEDGREYLK